VGDHRLPDHLDHRDADLRQAQRHLRSAPLFIIAIVIFLIGSLAAGFSTSMYELAVFRALQGLGAGGLMALPLAIMGDILAPANARSTRATSCVFGVSA
jgi:MFS family permease